MSNGTRRLVDDRTRIYRESRLEIKFVLTRDAGERAAEILAARSQAVEDPGGATCWDVESTYLDDRDLSMVRAAHADPLSCVRVRTRDYPRPGRARPDRVWLEVKRMDGQRTRKTRFPIPRAQLGGVLAAREERDLELDTGEAAREAVRLLRGLPAGTPLLPVAEVSYRRQAFILEGAPGADCRATLDHGLRYRLPRLTSSFAHRDPTVCEDAHYLEVKGAMPPRWLLEALGEPLPEQFSKFVLVTGDYLEYERVLRRAQELEDGRS